MKSKQKNGSWLCLRENDWLVPAVLMLGIALSLFALMMSRLSVYHLMENGETQLLLSFRDNPEEAAQLAGFDPEDYAVESVRREGRHRIHVTIREKIQVDITVDGETVQYIGLPATVEEILEHSEIALDGLDEVTPQADTLLESDGGITVTRVELLTQTSEESIPYQSYKRTTDQLLQGESRVVQQGQDGVQQVTHQVLLRDGQVADRWEVSRVTLQQPQSEILETGTAGRLVTRSGVERYRRVLTVTATAYTAGGTTASGTTSRVGAIAVDPSVIPLGSRLYITSLDGSSWVYGYAVAEDTGGAIRGNKIDLCFNSESECITFGRRQARVYILS